MNRSTLIALLVFVVLAVVALVTMREKPERGISRLDLSHVVVDSVDRILIGDDDGIALEKKGGRWLLDGKMADGRTIERVVQSIAALTSGDLASRNPDRYADLEVDEEKGVRLRVYGGGAELADLVVGGASSGGSYVRVRGEVFSVRGFYRATFERDRAGWVERRAFFDESDSVESVTVSLVGAKPYELVKKGDEWELSDPALLEQGARFDAEAATRLVRALVTMRASDVLDGEPDGAPGGEGAADRLTFRVADDATPRTLDLGEAVDGLVIGRSSARSHLLSLRATTVDSARKAVSDLRDWRIASFDPGVVTKLEIVEGPRRLVLDKSDGRWAVVESSDALADGFALDSAAVSRRLTAINRLVAVDEAGADGEGQADGDAGSVTLTIEGGSPVEIRFGGESEIDDETVVRAVGNLDDKTYLVAAKDRDRILAGAESFRQAEAGASDLGQIDPAALQNLPPEIRDSLLKQMAEERQRDELMKRAIEAQAAAP